MITLPGWPVCPWVINAWFKSIELETPGQLTLHYIVIMTDRIDTKLPGLFETPKSRVVCYFKAL